MKDRLIREGTIINILSFQPTWKHRHKQQALITTVHFLRVEITNQGDRHEEEYVLDHSLL